MFFKNAPHHSHPFLYPFLNTRDFFESSHNILPILQITTISIMATVEYMARGFVHIVESPPESPWLRLRGPAVENLNLTQGPTTQAEIWQMRFNRHLWSLLVEIWLTEYRQGWSVGFPFSFCLVSIFCLSSTNPILIVVRRLFRIESPFFEVGDVLNNGTEVPHFRSVVVFARFARNEAWGIETRTRSFGEKKEE